jgi:hypothetical protein
MCYYINIEITRSFSSFLIFYSHIYYIIDIKSAYKISHENPYMRLHTAYTVCDDHPHVYWNSHFKSLVLTEKTCYTLKNRHLTIFSPTGYNNNNKKDTSSGHTYKKI